MECNLGSFGAARVVGQVHAGERFDVYEVDSGGRRLALKVPAERRPAEGARPYRATRVLGGVSTIWNVICNAGAAAAQTAARGETQEVTAEELLADEAQRLRDVGPSWNHAVLDLVRCELAGRGELPGLLMPWHPGATLASLPRSARRRLLPRMMLSLWDALAAGLHGDMHGENLILAPAEDRFAVIDPGAMILHHHPEYMASSGSDVLTFVSNAEMYPVLPPYAITPPLSEGLALREHWESFVQSMTLDDLAPPFRVGQNVIGHAVSPAAGRFLVNLPGKHGEPHPADLLAVGILYYRALAGAHPLYDEQFSQPAWVGLEAVDNSVSGAGQGRARLGRGIPTPSSLVPEVQPEEDALALALVDLQVPSRGRLLELSAAAALAAERGST